MMTLALKPKMITRGEALRQGVRVLQQARIETASLDARILLEHVLDVSREQLLIGADMTLTPLQESRYFSYISAREARQPIAQLTGKREFWGLTLKVNEKTLDPRADSETLIESVLALVSDRDKPMKILDLGTGSGCLLLALLAELPNAQGLGVDLCKEALAVAKENAISCGLQSRATFMASSWCDDVAGEFDIIVSNPPYIPTKTIETLDPEVSEFEPKLALDGGEDGLDCYRAIMKHLPTLLAPKAVAGLEFGFGQKQALETLAKEYALQVIAVKHDLNGIPRSILIQR